MSNPEQPLDPPETTTQKYIQNEEEWKESNLTDTLTEFIEDKADLVSELIVNDDRFSLILTETFEFQRYLHQKYADAYSDNADMIYDERREDK